MKLRGIFQSVDFNNKDRFSDAMLERLLQHFERYDLRNSNVDADMLGNACEYLIKQFADDGGKKGGEFYTPKEVVRLMVRCLEIDEGMSVYDSTCGSGGMLLEAYRAAEQSGKNARSLSLFWARAEPEHLGDLPDEPVPSRYRRRGCAPGRHPARTKAHRGRRARRDPQL